MGSLKYGPGCAHIKASKGPDCNIMKFYITEYSSHYGQENFLPRLGRHTGTGYKSNFRPGMYYTSRLDDMDNPAMGKAIATNYKTITTLDYQPVTGPNGKEPLPSQTSLVKSGFVRDMPRTIPTNYEIRSVCFNTRQHTGALKGVYKPLIHRHKDPVEQENAGHGPASFSTETHAKFNDSNRPMPVDISQRTVGPKEGSGFTHAQNIEPITFLPSQSYNDERNWYLPIGSSVMKTDFSNRSPRIMDPMNAQPISKRAERGTGYTKDSVVTKCYSPEPYKGYTTTNDLTQSALRKTKKNDPAEYSNIVYPFPNISMTTTAFQRRSPNIDRKGKLGNVVIGNKEQSGFTQNNSKYVEAVETPHTLKRFGTEYTARYYNKNPIDNERMGRTDGSVMSQLPNGFTKGTQLHDKSIRHPDVELRDLHPYTSRSLRARYPNANPITN